MKARVVIPTRDDMICEKGTNWDDVKSKMLDIPAYRFGGTFFIKVIYLSIC